MGALGAAAGAAAVQHSLTGARGWHDISGSLVRGGALQLHSSLPPARAAPSRLLRLDPDEKPRVSSPTGFAPRARPPGDDKLAQRRLETALRDRVARTPRLTQDLKEECLERLDKIRETMPPEALRRPSWIHDKDGEGIPRSPDKRGQQAAWGALGTTGTGCLTSPSSSNHGSIVSSPSVPPAPVSTLSSQGPSTAVAASMAGATAAATEDMGTTRRGLSPPPPRRQRFLRASPGGNAASGGGHNSPQSPRRSQRTTPSRDTLSGWVQETPLFNPIVWPAWRCTAKATDPKPRRPTVRRAEQPVDVAQAPTEVLILHPGRSASVPVLAPTMSGPPVTQVIEARRAVAAARDALAWLAQGPDGGAEVPALPVRGTGSLLRTSLRYVLQT
mmetsp:Transcript_80161/g.249809  ORF Transcript_80161/g.249809 Transcript_80161/m.249809 type:complete len:388 (-) Transcript_80161:112-1275(-)